MGYYSDVICVFTKDAYENFKKLYQEKLEIEWEEYPLKDEIDLDGFRESFMNPTSISPDGNFVLLDIPNEKWYEDSEYYPEVKAFMKALEELNVTGYKYIRIGQDRGDEDCLGELYDEPFNVQYVRKFEYNSFEQDEEISMSMN